MNLRRVAVQCYKIGQQRQVALSTSASRQASGEVHPGYKKIKAKYEKFQIDDGVPIHLKGGAVDRILYYTTLGMCAVGIGACLEYYYSASFPKKAGSDNC